jgi:hypothetical protein
MEESGSVQIITDPDPIQAPKHTDPADPEHCTVCGGLSSVALKSFTEGKNNLDFSDQIFLIFLELDRDPDSDRKFLSESLAPGHWL